MSLAEEELEGDLACLCRESFCPPSPKQIMNHFYGFPVQLEHYPAPILHGLIYLTGQPAGLVVCVLLGHTP
jgi:hypothetical protein